MLNLCYIVAAILKIATGRNFSMAGINSGHHYLPTYQNYDVPNSFLTLKNLYRSPFSKWSPQYRTNSTLFDFNEIMAGINSGHHYLPTYQILMISDNVEFLRYCGSHFENGDW
jgi:hypothetical protein